MDQTLAFRGQARLGAPAGDPIADARDLLRRAARLPYQAAHANAWSRRFRRLATDARRAIAAHVLRYERSDSPTAAAVEAAPHLLPAVRRDFEEHIELLRRSYDLVVEAEGLDSPTIWTMVELGEQAMLLSRALDRHHNRVLTIVHEANQRDIGGEAG
ncbi:MAG: hypothetical protein HYX53_09970 [Chloroflexi bacterium]|nr:hypothetical protein [Chloroflexota bacterium]